jgi:hypothetical protein
MKKTLSIIACIVYCASFTTLHAQNVSNPGFENWENVGTDTEEPLDWNSFKTASGDLSSFGAKQIRQSTVVRPGSSGMYSALIWSRSVFGVVANGNVTTGQINMGNMTPSHQSNYNISRTANPAFSEALGAQPDSIVFWVKYVPANSGGSDMARMRAVIHDAYDYRDPATSDPNAADHVVGDATLNFPTTNGTWERKSVAFDYPGPASNPDFILITFTTNMTPGGGSGGDSLYIDDIEMIYNNASVHEQAATPPVSILTDMATQSLIADMRFSQKMQTKILISDIQGRLMYSSEHMRDVAMETINISALRSGVYIFSLQRTDGTHFVRKFIVQ